MHIVETYSNGVWTGRAASEGDFAPPGYRLMNEVPPAPGAGQVALAVGADWVLIDAVDAPAEVVASPLLRTTKIDFMRLLTLSQRVTMLAIRADVRAMTLADYADPAKAGLVGAALMFEQFDLASEFVELGHPETIYGVSVLMVGAGIFGPDLAVAAAEAARVLSNTPPTE